MQINNGIDIIYIPNIKKILTPHILNKLFTLNFNLHQELKKKVKNITFSLSISHDHNYAIAFVVALFL